MEKQTKEGYFGDSTPSSKKPFKENSKSQNNGGAKLGHKGYGRSSISETEADDIINLEHQHEVCPDCGGELKEGSIDRSVIDGEMPKTKKVLYKCQKSYCPTCKKTIVAKPTVLPKNKYSNNLLSTIITMHYLEGVPMRRVAEILGEDVNFGSAVNAFHYIADIFNPLNDAITKDYRASKVKHADETSWRTDGVSGYAWLFASDKESIFKFANTRSSTVPVEVFGSDKLHGVLVTDRYAGYNVVNCEKQYCLVHLLREVKKTEKEFAEDSVEVKNFTSTVSPILSSIIKLRNKYKRNKQIYYKKAKDLAQKLKDQMSAGSKHLAIKHIQDIFLNNENKLYQWVNDIDVPADNNRAERELRPTVIARKVSFCSQSVKGAQTRSTLMTVLHTAKKRLKKVTVADWLKQTLDAVATSKNVNIIDLFPKK
jgi:transposase